MRKGVSRTSFHIAIRNHIYCGKVFVPKHKDEEACFVEGQHEPLINEELFDKVQEILDGKKRPQRPTQKSLFRKTFLFEGF